jgi:hypothetical protein
MRTLTCAAIVFLAALTSAQSRAEAGDRPFRVAVAARSKTAGLTGQVVRRIERLPGRGRDVVMADALDRFVPAGDSADKARRASQGDVTTVFGKGWMMEVRGTGERVRFYNQAYINSSSNRPISKLARPSGDVLEAAGRKLIESELWSFVKLGHGEELKAWSVSYLVNGVTDKTGAIDEAVVASRILFTRVIGGVPVLGPGNKVSVTVANDGTLVGFDVDWPDLVRADEILPTSEIGTIRAAADAKLGVVSGKARPVEEVFECGYYDSGIAGLSAGSGLQPACVVIVNQGPGFKPMAVVPCTVK